MQHPTRRVSVAVLALGVLALGAPGWATTEATWPVVHLRITEPTEGQTLKGDSVTVRFEIRNYDLNSGGQHVHVILDNEPYRPHYDENAPVVFKDVAPGTHTIRMFPSRPWHESLKNPEAFAMVTFHVGEPSGDNKVEWQEPLLTYSRPKGSYSGAAAERILLDFWLLNATLHPNGYRVRVTVDGESEVLSRWEPVWLDGLGSGDHTITLELLGRFGDPIPGPYNRTTRTITVNP